MAFQASAEIKLFPVVIREYRKPEDDFHEQLIEYFKDYPSHMSKFPSSSVGRAQDF